MPGARRRPPPAAVARHAGPTSGSGVADGMDLPVMPPVRPMLAKSVKGIPDPAKFEGGLSFEPKWDGFRCIVFRDGDEVELASRNTKPLTRYFPEVVAAIREQLPERCVLDGELFVAVGRPARVRGAPGADPSRRLAGQHAGGVDAGRRSSPSTCSRSATTSYVDRPLSERRAAARGSAVRARAGPCHLTRTTTDPAEARSWFDQFEGAGLDGVVAKPLGCAVPGERAVDAQDQARAHRRRRAVRLPAAQDLHAGAARCSARCCSGLYDGDGKLQHVGVSACFTPSGAPS